MGRTISSLLLTRRSSLRVATTVPTTLASSIGVCGESETSNFELQTSDFLLGLLRLADREHVLEIRVRTRDDVHRDQLADATRGGGTRVRCGLDGRDIAADDGGH